MNTNPRVTRILCYGDSNTWGKVPDFQNLRRYSVEERWTGLLQAKLGDHYEILEEGLNSRTTDLDDPDPAKPGRNGLQLLMPILETHNPIDLIILMLGTNDLKVQYQRTAEQITEGMARILDEIEKFSQKVKIARPNLMLISPPLVKEVPGRKMYVGAAEKSAQLAPLYQRLAAEYAREDAKCFFIDAAQHLQPSEIDGVHLEKAAHQKLAEVIYEVLMSKP